MLVVLDCMAFFHMPSPSSLQQAASVRNPAIRCNRHHHFEVYSLLQQAASSLQLNRSALMLINQRCNRQQLCSHRYVPSGTRPMSNCYVQSGTRPIRHSSNQAHVQLGTRPIIAVQSLLQQATVQSALQQAAVQSSLQQAAPMLISTLLPAIPT